MNRSLFPSLGAAGSYSTNPVNTINTQYRTQAEVAHTSGTGGISLPSQGTANTWCWAWVFSFLNVNPKRQRYLFWEFENRQGRKSNLSLFIPCLPANDCSASLLLSQGSICVLGNSKFTNVMFGNCASIFFLIMAQKPSREALFIVSVLWWSWTILKCPFSSTAKQREQSLRKSILGQSSAVNTWTWTDPWLETGFIGNNCCLNLQRPAKAFLQRAAAFKAT